MEYLAAINSTQTLNAILILRAVSKNADVLTDNISREMDINIIEAMQIPAAIGKSDSTLLSGRKDAICNYNRSDDSLL